jgi:tetratricopeptide (TPR) repeat protein
MHHTGQIIRGILIGLFAVLVFGAIIYETMRKSDDPVRMLFKWIGTAIMLCVLLFVVGPIVAQGGYGGAFGGIPAAAVCGVVLAIIWRHSLASLVAKPFSSLYDGGDTPPEPQPLYSIARSRQKQGHYPEAIAEVRKQLERFPTDVEGQLLLAEIQAEDLKDLQGAEVTIQRFCAQPNHAPKNIVFALYALADWHLKYGQDLDSAKRALQQIIDLLPDTEFSAGAAQRIAHLSSPDMLLAPHDRKRFAVPEGIHNVGLVQAREQTRAPEADPATMAAEYVKHLERHPLDMEVREKLAVIYAETYGRMDMARDQLEEMIAQPNQPGKLIVHWLNLLADLQIKSGADYETVSGTLQRIIDRDPNLASAEMARHRMALLKLELKANAKKQGVKLGSYEQNLGLKQGLPHRR